MYKDVAIKFFLSVSFVISASVFSATTSAVELVTHMSVEIEKMSTQQLRRIYAKRQLQWGSGEMIVVFVLPTKNQVHHQFAINYLHLFPYQLNRIWHRLAFSGVGTAPVVVNSLPEMLEAVQNTPGAIGYVDSVPEEYRVNVVQVENANEI